jgi:hypothetical protein
MRGVFKTLFGDTRIVIITAINLCLGYALLHTPAAGIVGLIIPPGFILGAAFLAKY